MTKLSPREEAFVQEYLKDLNTAAAAERAGYAKRSARQQGHVVLHRPHVQAAIVAARAAIEKRNEITVDRVIREIAAIAFADVRKLYGEDGQLLQPGQMDDETAAAVAGIEVEEIYAGTGADRTVIGHLAKVKRWDKPKALEMLSRHLGIYDDGVKVNVTGSVAIYLPSNGRGGS